MARYLVTYVLGSTIPTRTKYVDDASGPPDANVDAGTDGVAFGSVLWDGTDLWMCADATTGAAVWKQIEGGGGGDSSLLIDLSVSGATDVDRNDAATHDLTLVGNTTLTPIHSDPPTGEAIDLRVIVRQDSGGGNTLAFGGTIDWASGSAPTMPSGADDLITLGFLSLDDGATWLGYAGVTDDQTATEVPFTPTGTIAATDVQSAVAEVSGDVSAHTGDTSDAHDASAISIVDSGSYYTSTDVEGALQEIGAGGIGGGGGLGPLLIADTHSTPIIFADLLLTEEEDDFLYGDTP